MGERVQAWGGSLLLDDGGELCGLHRHRGSENGPLGLDALLGPVLPLLELQGWGASGVRGACRVERLQLGLGGGEYLDPQSHLPLQGIVFHLLGDFVECLVHFPHVDESQHLVLFHLYARGISCSGGFPPALLGGGG